MRTSRLRAQGRILEIGPRDLAFSVGEASALLRNTGVTLDDDDAARLYDRTEGWPAGLYLAALYLREGGSVAAAAGSFAGDDWTVSGYMESELLSGIPRQQREFLTRTAVLERMSGPLCDAVLERHGSATTLKELAGSNLLLIPLDRRGEWYRYHHLFRDMLLADLGLDDPSLAPVLRRRAAAWCEDNDRPEAGLEYAMASGDVDMAARLVEQLVVATDARQEARITTFLGWFRWLQDRGGVEGHPLGRVAGAGPVRDDRPGGRGRAMGRRGGPLAVRGRRPPRQQRCEVGRTTAGHAVPVRGRADAERRRRGRRAVRSTKPHAGRDNNALPRDGPPSFG